MPPKQTVDDLVANMKGELIYLDPWAIEDPPILMHVSETEEGLNGLADSMSKVGQINPICVRKKGDHYQLIAGWRRREAAKRIPNLQLQAKLVDIDDKNLKAILLEENLSRAPHNPYTEIMLVQSAIEDDKLSISELSKRFGWSDGWIRTRLEIGKMPEDVKKLIFDGQLQIGLAHLLAQLPSRDLQTRFAYDFANGQYDMKTAQAILKNYFEMQERLQRPLTETETKKIFEIPLQKCQWCVESKSISDFTTVFMCNECSRHILYLWEKERQEMKMMELRVARNLPPVTGTPDGVELA